MTEEWRDITGYEGIYKVSNMGRVLSLERLVWNGKGYKTEPQKILKQGRNHKGYPIVYLSKDAKQKTISVHRLMAKAFIPNPLNKPQVNHIDGVKTNNIVSNLEWCTNQENQEHAVLLKLNDHTKYDSGKPKRAVLKVDQITGEVLGRYGSIAEASRAIGHRSKSNIGTCCRGLKKSVGGYKWIYESERKVM